MLCRPSAVASASRRVFAFAVFFVVGTLLRAQPAGSVEELAKKIASAPAARKSAAFLALSEALDSIDTDRAYDAVRQARETATRPHDELLAEARLATLL